MVPLLWLGLFFTVMQFGSSKFDTYMPFPHKPRYLLPMLAAGAVLAGAVLAGAVLHRLSRWRMSVAVAVFAAYAMPSLLLAFVAPVQTHTTVVAAQRAADELHARGARVAYSDSRFAALVNYFARCKRSGACEVTPWIQMDLKRTADPCSKKHAWVVRYDPSLRRFLANLESDAPTISGLDEVYQGVEQVSARETVTIDHGQSQRSALRFVRSVVDFLPLPAGVQTRVSSALGRHLADTTLVLYRVESTAEPSQPVEKGGRE